jgi:hypothetical protein
MMKPKYNRCDGCGRNAHQVAVVETDRPTGKKVCFGYCNSCYTSKSWRVPELSAERVSREDLVKAGRSTLVYDRRVRKPKEA